MQVHAQITDVETAILAFSGAASVEEVDPYEAERLEDLLQNPLKINTASHSRLVSSGLLSHYQASSLVDYRSRHGDVLSYAELALLDGFSEDFVRVLTPFISLYSMKEAGRRAEEKIPFELETAVRGGMKTTLSDAVAPPSLNYAAKVRARIGETISFAAAGGPTAFSGHMALSPRRLPSKVVIGDFNARFGQGLAMWNGMTMSGMASPSAFMKSSSGIGESWSFTGSSAMTGVAADLSWRNLVFSALAAAPGVKNLKGTDQTDILPACNVSWNGRNHHLGITHYARFSGIFRRTPVSISDMKTSMDFSYCISGTDIFSEVAYDWVNAGVAALGGTIFPAGENLRMAIMFRYYPADYSSSLSGAARSGTKCSNEHGISLSGSFSSGKWIAARSLSDYSMSVRRHTGTFSADVSYHPQPKGDSDFSLQTRLTASWEIQMSPGLQMEMRVTERLRTWGHPCRTDFRTDLRWTSSRFGCIMRLNLLHSVSLAGLAYAEGGFKEKNISIWLRQGAFIVDNWDDRIYAYERDAPGSFNVPAFYGRGLWTSLTASWRFARWGRAYIRASMTTYPFMKSKKPGKAELKLQFVFRL